MKVLAVVLLARTLALVSAASSAVKIQAKNDSMFEEVVGGTNIDIIYIRTQVAILELEKLLCSGNIIKDNVILSVAHALYGRTIAQLKVRSGSNFFNTWGLLVHVAATVVHPQYKHCHGCYNYDIALAILQRPAVVHGIHAESIQLVDADTILPPGTIARVSAWGATTPNGPPSMSLLTIMVPIISQGDCAVEYGPDVARDHICGGNGLNHICPGDSGAGLVVNGKLAGIVALGQHCGLADTSSCYTSIAAHRPWIIQTVGV